MATYSKKRRVGDEVDEKVRDSGEKEESDSSLDEEEEGYDDDDSLHDEINEEVQVEFEALPPQDNDFHGIKRLLHQLFLKSLVNLSDLTNLILSQNQVGSVLKQSEAQLAEESDSSDDDDDEDHVYGITTVINMSDKKDEDCIKDVRRLIEERCSKCASPADRDQILRTMNDPDHSVGLMINERFVNIPPQLAPPLHKSLQKDLALASRKNPKFRFDYYLLISKSYREPVNSQAAKGKKKKNKSRAPQEEASSNELLFTNAEDEYFHKAAMLSFDYPVTAESDSALGGTWSFDDVEYQTFRTVMIVPSSKMAEILSQIEENLTV